MSQKNSDLTSGDVVETNDNTSAESSDAKAVGADVWKQWKT